MDEWTSTWCPIDGPDVGVDEDGCCVVCGGNAVGEGAEAAVKLQDERQGIICDRIVELQEIEADLEAQVDALRAERTEALARAERAERRENADIAQTDGWFADIARIVGARTLEIGDIITAATDVARQARSEQSDAAPCPVCGVSHRPLRAGPSGDLVCIDCACRRWESAAKAHRTDGGPEAQLDRLTAERDAAMDRALRRACEGEGDRRERDDLRIVNAQLTAELGAAQELLRKVEAERDNWETRARRVAIELGEATERAEAHEFRAERLIDLQGGAAIKCSDLHERACDAMGFFGEARVQATAETLLQTSLERSERFEAAVKDSVAVAAAKIAKLQNERDEALALAQKADLALEEAEERVEALYNRQEAWSKWGAKLTGLPAEMDADLMVAVDDLLAEAESQRDAAIARAEAAEAEQKKLAQDLTRTSTLYDATRGRELCLRVNITEALGIDDAVTDEELYEATKATKVERDAALARVEALQAQAQEDSRVRLDAFERTRAQIRQAEANTLALVRIGGYTLRVRREQ